MAPEQRSRGLAGKALHTFSTLIFGQAASIATGIVLARAYGPAGKGILSFAGILILFALVAASGLKSAMGFQIGTAKRPMREVFGSSLIAVGGLGLAGTAIMLVLWRIQPSQPAYLAAAIAFPFALYLHTVSGLYLLCHRVERVNVKIMLTVGGGGSLITLVAVLLFHVPLTVALALWVATFLAGAVVNTIGLTRMIGGGPLFAGRELVREQLRLGGIAAGGSMLMLLAQRADVFVVNAKTTAVALGVYTLAVASGEMMWQISRSLSWSSSGHIATAPREEAIALTARVVRTVLALQIVVGVVAFTLGPWLIEAVYGQRFAGSGAVLRWLLPGIVLYSADETIAYFLNVVEGRPGFVAKAEAMNLALCFGISLAAVPAFGLAGAAVASSIAYITAFTLKAVAFARATKISAPEFLIARPADLPGRVRAYLHLPNGAGA